MCTLFERRTLSEKPAWWPFVRTSLHEQPLNVRTAVRKMPKADEKCLGSTGGNSCHREQVICKFKVTLFVGVAFCNLNQACKIPT